MGNINDLGLKDDAGAADLPDEVPEQRGEFRPNPVPGWWVLRLPADVRALWDIQEAADPREPKGTDKKVQRVKIRFDDNDSPLEILAAPPGGDPNYPVGAGLGGTVSNLERRRGKKDDEDAPLVSDMYYFLEALGHDMEALRAELKKQPKKANQLWAQAVNQHGGGELKIKTTWSAQCRADKVRYIWETNDAGEYTGNSVEDPEQGKGCGERVYMGKIPKGEDGKPLERFACPKCNTDGTGAVIRAFSQFDQFRPVPVEEKGQQG